MRDAGSGRPASRVASTKRATGIGVVVLVAAWLVAFIAENSESVRVSFVFGHASVSLIWVMIICALLGGALAAAVPRLAARRR